MNFSKDIILENDHVLLSPLKMEHVDALIGFSINEPELWQYSLQPANGKANLEKYIATAIQSRKENKGYPFIVFDKHKQQFAGSTRFYDYNATHETTQLGFTWYGKAFQRTGLNKNCKLLLLEFAFGNLALERVEFRADNNNQRSIKAMKSIGCIEEGVLRSNCNGIDSRRDSIVLSILKSEWELTVKSNLIAQINSYL